MLTHGSLFSGIGGFDLAAHWAGIPTLWQVEKDDYCRAVLRKHFPEAKQYEDIKDVGSKELASVSIISGGFPCQPFSVAGKQRGKADDRYLWPEMLRVIAEVRPTWVIAENVAGIIRMELDSVLASLEAEGYTAWPLVIPACGVGARHRRNRVWIMGYSESQRRREAGNDCERSTKRIASTSDVADAQSIEDRRLQFARVSANIGASCQEREPPDVTEYYEADYVADSIIEQWNRRGEWASWWEREPQETLRHVGRNRWEENGVSIAESLLGRVVDGLPARVDRLKGLGNAIVPQVAYQIFKAIKEVEGI